MVIIDVIILFDFFFFLIKLFDYYWFWLMNFKLVLIFSLSLPNIPVKRIAQEM